MFKIKTIVFRYYSKTNTIRHKLRKVPNHNLIYINEKNTFTSWNVTVFSLSAQKRGKDYSEILKSNNIYEINAFLRDAHPDDPRRSVLKPRVMEMMKEYIKDAHPEDQKVKDMQEMLALLRRRPSTKITFDEMNAIIKQKQIAKYKAELAAKNQRRFILRVLPKHFCYQYQHQCCCSQCRSRRIQYADGRYTG